MKHLKITLIALFISVVAYAQQGIVLQGIARDNNSAAITDKSMTFTFRITKSDGSDLYKETQQIKTDNFGVFSHVIGTGNAVTGSFGSLDFSEENLKAIISVNNNGSEEQIYDQKFEYVPYAKRAKTAEFADNGVPVGTVIPFLGDNAPKGWVMCDGQSIVDSKYQSLRDALAGATTVPDLRGRFLKGAGYGRDGVAKIPITEIDEAGVRQYQKQSIKKHKHDSGNLKTDSQGAHQHSFRVDTTKDGHIHGKVSNAQSFSKYSMGLDLHNSHSKFTDRAYQVEYTKKGIVSEEGNHSHNVNSGSTGEVGGEENRPWSYTVNYIIKY